MISLHKGGCAKNITMEYFQSKHIDQITYKSGSGKQHDDGRSPKQPTPIGF